MIITKRPDYHNILGPSLSWRPCISLLLMLYTFISYFIFCISFVYFLRFTWFFNTSQEWNYGMDVLQQICQLLTYAIMTYNNIFLSLKKILWHLFHVTTFHHFFSGAKGLMWRLTCSSHNDTFYMIKLLYITYSIIIGDMHFCHKMIY